MNISWIITIDQINELLNLRQQVLRAPLGLNLFDEDLTKETKELKLGAFIEEKLVGCLMLVPLSNTIIKLRQMAVDNNLQGNGIGAQLVQFALNYCALNNYNTMELHARANVINFYKKLGFTIIGDMFIEVGIPHYKMVIALQ